MTLLDSVCFLTVQGLSLFNFSLSFMPVFFAPTLSFYVSWTTRYSMHGMTVFAQVKLPSKLYDRTLARVISSVIVTWRFRASVCKFYGTSCPLACQLCQLSFPSPRALAKRSGAVSPKKERKNHICQFMNKWKKNLTQVNDENSLLRCFFFNLFTFIYLWRKFYLNCWKFALRNFGRKKKKNWLNLSFFIDSTNSIRTKTLLAVIANWTEIDFSTKFYQTRNIAKALRIYVARWFPTKSLISLEFQYFAIKAVFYFERSKKSYFCEFFWDYWKIRKIKKNLKKSLISKILRT